MADEGAEARCQGLARGARALEVVRQRGEAGRRQSAFVQQTPSHLPVRLRPVRTRASRDEADRVALVVDALGLRVDPAVAERHLLQVDEGDGLLARRLLVDRDDDLALAFRVCVEPAIEFAGGPITEMLIVVGPAVFEPPIGFEFEKGPNGSSR